MLVSTAAVMSAAHRALLWPPTDLVRTALLHIVGWLIGIADGSVAWWGGGLADVGLQFGLDDLSDGVSASADGSSHTPEAIQGSHEDEQNNGDEAPGGVDHAGPGVADAGLGGDGRCRVAQLEGRRR